LQTTQVHLSELLGSLSEDDKPCFIRQVCSFKLGG
jgi:hypothetical protein